MLVQSWIGSSNNKKNNIFWMDSQVIVDVPLGKEEIIDNQQLQGYQWSHAAGDIAKCPTLRNRGF